MHKHPRHATLGLVTFVGLVTSISPCHVPAGNVNAGDGMLDGKALAHGHCVRDTVSRVKHNTRGAAGSVAINRTRRQKGD